VANSGEILSENRVYKSGRVLLPLAGNLTTSAMLSSGRPSKDIGVAVDVTNTGKRVGAEVVQVYVGHPPAVMWLYQG
jgi:hypothetical protein